jgi:hypothetical protein
MGRVMEVIIGHDNKIRSVRVKRGDGHTYHYSICHLYPLELSLTHPYQDGQPLIHSNDSEENRPSNSEIPQDEEVDQQIEGNLPSNHQISNNQRPVRKAALKCREFIQDNLHNL